MKILLVVPTHHYNPASPLVEFLSASDFPTGFAFLASSLKEAGHRVVGCNPNNITGYQTAFQMINAKIRESLKENKPDLVGLGGLCTDYAFIRDAIQIIRKAAPLTPIVLGGGIVTYDAEYIMNLLKPDFCIIGEGEETIVKLADFLDAWRKGVIRHGHMGKFLAEIDNLGWWEG